MLEPKGIPGLLEDDLWSNTQQSTQAQTVQCQS